MSSTECLRVFDLHDVHRARELPKDEIAHVIRSCGRMLTDDQMNTLLAPLPDKVSRQKFSELIGSIEAPKEKDLLTALQAFDNRDAGELTRADVTAMLTQMSAKLTPDELEQLLQDCPFTADDKVKIPSLQQHLTRPHTKIKASDEKVVAVGKSAA